MPMPAPIRFAEPKTDDLADLTGALGVLVAPDGALGPDGRKLPARLRRALARLTQSDGWARAAEGDVTALDWPSELSAEQLLVVKLSRKPSQEAARRAGAKLALARGARALTLLAGRNGRVDDVALGLALRGYGFEQHRSAPPAPPAAAEIRVVDPDKVAKASGDLAAVAEGVFFTRDLVNEPANVLTTTDFAARLAAMQELGLEVEILEEAELAKLGMRLLLGVGQGSDSPSKVVVMRWNGGGDAAPLALVGKGVVFDTGGISLKPAAGMEDMTGDMGGAGTVAGVMRTLALRRAKANVVGLVGLVENMPSGSAIRPGDVIRSMKGDTVEVINTDAEGRLVLADLLWYAQDRFAPAAVIDLATLTGAMLVALGHEHAGVFSNDDGFAADLIAAARAEGEGAWQMPCDAAYDSLLESRLADVANVGGRKAGSITAARFLARFIQEGTPWIHLDIAGASASPKARLLSPKGATGWGVMTLNRLIQTQQG